MVGQLDSSKDPPPISEQQYSSEIYKLPFKQAQHDRISVDNSLYSSFSIAIANASNLNECAFHRPKPCDSPGIVAEITIFILRAILNYPNATFHFVKADGWAFNNRKVSSSESKQNESNEDRSVMGLLHSGKADFSEADMDLRSDRMAKVRQIGSLIQNAPIIVFKDDKTQRDSSLNFSAIRHWNLYACALASIVVVYAIVLLLKRLRLGATLRQLIRDFIRQNSAMFGIFMTLFLRFLSSDIVLIINNILPSTNHFQNAADVIDALESEEYQSVAIYQLTVDDVINPSVSSRDSTLIKRMQAIAQKRPPLRANGLDEAMNMVLNPTKGDKKYLFFAYETDLDQIRRSYCGFGWISASEIYFGSYSTIYVRPGLWPLRTKTGRESHKPLIGWEYQRLRRSYYKDKICPPSHSASGVNSPAAVVSQQSKALSLDRIKATFWFYVTAIAVAGSCFILEFAFAKFESFMIKRKKLRLLFRNSIPEDGRWAETCHSTKFNNKELSTISDDSSDDNNKNPFDGHFPPCRLTSTLHKSESRKTVMTTLHI